MRAYLLSFILLLLLSPLELFGELKEWLKPPIVPQPKDNPITEKKVKLGKLLFFDKRLSYNDTISCASCHDPKKGWSDARDVSIGVDNKKGKRNSPTIINSAYLTLFFHDGRAKSLEEQAKGPIEDKVEMNMPMELLVQKLKKIDGYRKLFEDAFKGEGITPDTIVKAIASFERTLITPDAPFDRFVKGDKSAINEDAKEGFSIFLERGKCDKCHSGFIFTNESFNNIGLGDTKDLGLYDLTQNRIWYAAFKTPTLRDIEKTAPYFHNGSIKTLNEAVTICGNGGAEGVKLRSPFFRDRELTKDEVKFVEIFLKTLTSPDIDIEPPLVFPK